VPQLRTLESSFLFYAHALYLGFFMNLIPIIIVQKGSQFPHKEVVVLDGARC
jgi:hypothetical protein